MPVDYTTLPVYEQKQRILDTLEHNQVIVVQSPTGSGKTTQIPIILHEAGYSSTGIIAVTQPRRIAALSVSEFIARQLKTTYPGLVGYKMRFEDKTDYSVLNKYKVVEQGSKVAILGLGNFFNLGEKVKILLKKNLGISATLINPRFITGIDEELMDSLKDNHSLVVTLEDGVLEGGFGEKIASYFGGTGMKVLNFGAKKEFSDRVPLEELYVKYHLTPDLIFEDINKCLD